MFYDTLLLEIMTRKEQMQTPPSILVWFRQDLRTSDHPALHSALEESRTLGACVVPVYIEAPDEEQGWPPGGASRWWLHHSLTSLHKELAELGLQLIIRKGNSLKMVQQLISETGATHLFWNRRYEPWAIKRDAEIKSTLKQQGIAVKSFNGSLLFEPWTIATKQGKPYQVFTPFWKAYLSQEEVPQPLPTPNRVSVQAPYLKSLKIEDLSLLPKTAWDEGIRKAWKPGSKEALKHLQNFIQEPIVQYKTRRDRPDLKGSSRLSPYLHFGEISPRIIWSAVKKSKKHAEDYLRQLGWREFAYHLLYHFPHTVEEPLRSEFLDFPWNYNKEWLQAWQKGKTGYPIVDAGMRELWTTGWMHNRVRMITGSFLVKDLLQPWQEGAKWFWDTLVDADIANNTLGWQWIGGCGADAAPYFRIFNPVLQGEKFDPDGAYVKKWLPELAKMPIRWLHRPWEAPQNVLNDADVFIGESYPKPIVDHREASKRALTAFKTMKEDHA